MEPNDTNESIGRRRFVTMCSSLGFSSTLFPGVLWARLQEDDGSKITRAMVRDASRLSGLVLSEQEVDLVMDGVQNRNFDKFEEIRSVSLDNSVAPPLYFDPRVPGMSIDRTRAPMRRSVSTSDPRPSDLEDVAFWPVTRLAPLVESRRIGALELTRMYLERLKRLNPRLNCVVNLTEERAIAQARLADEDIAAGNYRGPLHGIPWGAKDIIAAAGYPTSWGAEPFKDQVLDLNATVVERLDAAGAILVAKLTTGELAFGDQWFGGRTNNPWNPEHPELGSSGSSAGPGAATAAGLVGFSIGTDTGGSILSPSVRCGITGLRPTFGRISRYGVMAAGYSLDKIGPMCRSVEDCALVLSATHGPDGKDLAVPEDVPFNWDALTEARDLRIGFFESAFADTESREGAESLANGLRVVESLRSVGAELEPVQIPMNDLTYWIEYVERAAGFDEFARSGRDAGLRRTNHRGELRAWRLVSAVDFLQANRIRMLLMKESAEAMAGLDAVVAPWRAVNPLTSMTGHPVVVVPSGFDAEGLPTGVALVGQVYGEARLLAAAKALQDVTDYHLRHPVL